MQPSEHLIAYQTVSSAAYQRLRETLIQQKHVFESVMTEVMTSRSPYVQTVAQPPHHPHSHPLNSHPVHSYPGNAHSGNTLIDRAQTLNGLGVESFVLMCSPTLNVLLTAMPMVYQPPVHHAISESASHSMEYRVGLTFDDRAIAVFIDRLKSSSARSFQSETYHMSQRNTPSQHNVDPAFAHPASVSEDDKIIAQKAFVLSWAKNLAVSPEGDKQPTQDSLDNQVQQSLLLDQVITRIRHSLDLPAILETTVAQVREFLSADRLVLYQFDHFKVQTDSQLETLSAEDVFAQSVFAKRQSASGLVGEQFSAAEMTAEMTAEMLRVGTRSHSGHVTYESRATAGIPSVLHLSETECFEPSLPMRARYLMGKPIAVDNVEAQYAHIPCLLDFLKQAQVKSKIIAPIIVQDQLWGLLIAHQCENYRHWEATEAIFLQHIAEHLAVAITQASLYQQLRQQTVSLESCVIERTQSLHDALMAAESANITKGEFLSTMSHELRTPLTYIIGMSATLLRWSFGELNDRQRSYLTTINQSGEQLLDVINNILEFASVESGRSILDVSELSLSELMKSILAHHKDMADKKNVTLTLQTRQMSEDEDLFRADAKRLQQMIANLLNNAIKFTGAGGRVEVRVWREPRTAVFQIEDTGIGIPESQQDSLFEKFKQLESPFQRQYAGTGLGLAMTKRLVELHGGSIQIDSQVGKGSTFTVRLPVQSESMPPQHYQIPQLEEGPKRVILLETDEENAAIACEMLTAAGYEVIWLIESDQLAMQLNLLRPVMLIADLALIDPKISNVKAIQLAITALNAKVLALTTQSDSASASMAHHDILPKPIDPKALLSKVRKLMLAPV
jgi:two-component system, sensor histidine kinase and response regulator